MNRFFKATLIFSFFAFFLLLPFPAQAQTFSLAIWPPILEVMIKPGKSITQVYELSSQGEASEKINTEIATFKPADELGNVILTPKSASSPIEFNFENADIFLGQPFSLAPGKKQQIVLKIKVPQETGEGDYYFTLLFSTKPEPREGAFGSQEAGVIGGHILLTVSESGEPEKAGKIVEFQTKKLIDSLEKPEFTLRVKNTGQAFWKPFGAIKVKGLVGQSFEIPLRPDNVLAGSVRQILTATGSAAPKFLIGPYRAKVEFSLDDEGEKLSKTISFLAIPIKAVLAILIACLLILGVKSRQKTFFKKT